MQIAQLLGLGFHPLIPQGFCLKMSSSRQQNWQFAESQTQLHVCGRHRCLISLRKGLGAKKRKQKSEGEDE